MNKNLLLMTSGGNALLDGGGSSGTGGGSAGSSDDKGKGKSDDNNAKTFTQKELDSIIADRVARVESKFAGFDDMKAKLAELEQAQHERTVSDLAGQKKWEEATQAMTTRHEAEKKSLNDRIAELDGRYQKVTIDNALLEHATKFNAIDPADIVSLLRPNVKMGADGVPSFADGKSLADGVKAFLDAKPHFVKPQGRTGSGTHGNNSGGSSTNGTASGFDDITSVEQLRGLSSEEILKRVRTVSNNPFGAPLQLGAKS